MEQAGDGIESILSACLEHGVDRAAWLPFENNGIGHVVIAGGSWNGGVLRKLIHPRKPPYLLAFMQRQDVWIDFAGDERVVESDLARELKPAVFFLLPVFEGRTVRGCFYFDWIKPRDKAPNTFLPCHTALLDTVATQTLAA